MPSATPAIRYSMVAFGTKWDRSVPAPATVLKKISNTTCMITCIDCCSATAVVARTRAQPALLQDPGAQCEAADAGRGSGCGKSVGHLSD